MEKTTPQWILKLTDFDTLSSYLVYRFLSGDLSPEGMVKYAWDAGKEAGAEQKDKDRVQPAQVFYGRSLPGLAIPEPSLEQVVTWQRGTTAPGEAGSIRMSVEALERFAMKVVQWVMPIVADQELEACVKTLQGSSHYRPAADYLISERRPLSLAEEGLKALNTCNEGDGFNPENYNKIMSALERLAELEEGQI